MERPGFLVLSTRVDLVHSEGHETQNKHYGRSLTKGTLKDSISKLPHNGFCLRADAVASRIPKTKNPKTKKILPWFASQKHLDCEVSSLKFVHRHPT